MILTGQQRKILREGILQAYPIADELMILLSEEMDVKFDAIARGETYNTQVFNLIEYFEAKGRLAEFIRAIVTNRPSNPILAKIKREFAAEQDAVVGAAAAEIYFTLSGGEVTISPTEEIIGGDGKSEVKIFLAHANEDKAKVIELYNKLKAQGYTPWLDTKDLVPGQQWKNEIPKAIRSSDIFIACLSDTSVKKQGYVQSEFRLALRQAAEMPPDTIYLIPLKFDKCNIPDLEQSDYGIKLQDYQWLDYWEEGAFERLIEAIEYRRQQLNKVIKPLLEIGVAAAAIERERQEAYRLIEDFLRQAGAEIKTQGKWIQVTSISLSKLSLYTPFIVTFNNQFNRQDIDELYDRAK